MARSFLSSLVLLLGLATGSLLDNFEWLKQHGDEALEAAAHCQDVVVQLSKLSEHCRVTNQLENFAAVVSWIAIEQTGEKGSNSFLADLARSPPALAMKEKAQKAILASTQASMDEACIPECALENHHEFFEAFAGCYAPSVCAASGMGEVSFHRCRSSLQTFILNEMKYEASQWCQKDENGIYCQQHHAELMIQSPLCYSLYTAPVLEMGRDLCSDHTECVRGWKQAEEHPICSSQMTEIGRSRGEGMMHMLHQIWGARINTPSGASSYYDACIHPASQHKPNFIV
ncbi:unnamed protein product [Symbiodinium microadriaticum]|nr:unnamed protein product [Symbiodinium sp. KB8]CAE7702388.1 unnamed protein product [Symbiodinium microadriaticum]